MGAKIRGVGTHHLIVEGVKQLTPKDHELLPDYLEMGTFVCLASATRGDVAIKNFRPEFLGLEMELYKKAGVNIEVKKNEARVRPSSKPVSYTHLTLPTN